MHSSSDKRLIVDLSAVLWFGLYAGEDHEFGQKVMWEGKVVKVNSATHGYENVINHLVWVMDELGIVPSQMIFVAEGKDSKLMRRMILENYKGGAAKTRPDQMYAEFNKLKEMVLETFTKLGAVWVSQSNVESDDVIAYLCHMLPGIKYIDSSDADLSALISDEYGNATQNVYHWKTEAGKLLESNPKGPFPCKYMSVYKALVGDTSDKIPGCPGFGEKSWLTFLGNYGNEGLEELHRMMSNNCLDELADSVAEFKPLKKVIDNQELVVKSFKCALLYPERVNTARKPLEIYPGMVGTLPQPDERLKKWQQQARLVSAENYKDALAFFKSKVNESPYISFDLETSATDSSEEWLINSKGNTADDDLGVDVFGSTITSFSITFGRNGQYTYYVTVDHVEQKGCTNITIDQAKELIEAMPANKVKPIQNVAFELPVTMENYGPLKGHEKWHGFIGNAWDTKIMSSYVDENWPNGLKQNSKKYLNYEQVDYKTTTTKQGALDDLPPGGRIIGPVTTDPDNPEIEIVTKQYRMNELTAAEVFGYGTDDTICTMALFIFYKLVMDLEQTTRVFEEVEIKPAYLTAKAFVDGIECSIERLKELEEEDEKKYHEAAATLSRVMLENNVIEGMFEPIPEMTAAYVKDAFEYLFGWRPETKARKFDKIAINIESEAQEDHGEFTTSMHQFCEAMVREDLKFINALMLAKYRENPVIDTDSPKQMRKFLYEVLGIKLRAINKLTPLEKREKLDLADACYKFNDALLHDQEPELTEDQWKLVLLKAKTDDTAVDLCLAFDEDDWRKDLLRAMTEMKKVDTRRKLYYRPYPFLLHWKDKRLHPTLNQSAAVTRRYSASGPNVQQLPKKGEGVKVRQIILPHHKDAVVCSIDFSGQELRLMADQSQDQNMLSCYLGDNLKDIHCITAAGAMAKKWGIDKTHELCLKAGLDPEAFEDKYDLFVALRKSKDAHVHKEADDLRKVSKNVNFAAQFDSQALTLSNTIIVSVKDAQDFLDARRAMFGRVEEWKDEVRKDTERTGYATTMMGARRHLARLLLDPSTASKAGRQGPNFKIQGSAAEMTKLAMARIWDSNVFYDYDAVFYAPIHDEVVFSVHKDQALEAIEIVHACMTGQYADMEIPILGSISIGPNFGEQIECGDYFDPEAIKAALDNIFKKESDDAASDTEEVAG